MIRIEIECHDAFALSIELKNLLGLLTPAPPQIVQVPTTPPASDAVEAEVVDPPKKPGRSKKPPEMIEAKAEPAPAVEKKPELSFDKDVQPAMVEYVHEAAKRLVAEKGGELKDAQTAVFRELKAHFGAEKSKDLKPEQYQAVLDYIAERTPKED